MGLAALRKDRHNEQQAYRRPAKADTNGTRLQNCHELDVPVQKYSYFHGNISNSHLRFYMYNGKKAANVFHLCLIIFFHFPDLSHIHGMKFG